jgi:hypothetical protein
VDNDLQILEDGISQYHAKILFDNGKWVLYDLNSSNGTKVNGNTIRKPKELADKDVIHIADNAYRFEFDPAKEKPAPVKKEDNNDDNCIRIRSPEESKPSKSEIDDEKELTRKIPEAKKVPGNTPVKTEKEIADAAVMRRLVEQAVQKKKKKLRIIMFIVAVLVNAVILIVWLYRHGHITLP